MNRPVESRFAASSGRSRFTTLRLAALLTLVVNFALSEDPTLWTHWIIVLAYAAVSIASAQAAAPTTSALHLTAALDGVLVTAVLFENIVGRPVTNDHGVTTSSLVIAFILLSNIGLSLSRKDILIFCGIVLSAWLSMLMITAFRHRAAELTSIPATFFGMDLALAISFAFTSMAIYLTAVEQEKAQQLILRIEQKRHNLSRFFSPLIVAELQDASAVLDLRRRNAAIMFVDLRDFSAYAETAPAADLAALLADYRQLVAGTVFRFGGTVDKFIGDGVMAVFGQPEESSTDASRALACAFLLAQKLEEWRELLQLKGLTSFRTGLGLHYGTVVGGVLESGFHDEFTVIGDAVNVAQRLETMSKQLDASLVVSMSLLRNAGHAIDGNWIVRSGVLLRGRKDPVDIAYLPSLSFNPIAHEVGVVQIDRHKSSVQRSDLEASRPTA